MSLIRLLHWIGLTNISDDQMAAYEKAKRGQKSGEVVSRSIVEAAGSPSHSTIDRNKDTDNTIKLSTRRLVEENAELERRLSEVRAKVEFYESEKNIARRLAGKTGGLTAWFLKSSTIMSIENYLVKAQHVSIRERTEVVRAILVGHVVKVGVVGLAMGALPFLIIFRQDSVLQNRLDEQAQHTSTVLRVQRVQDMASRAQLLSILTGNSDRTRKEAVYAFLEMTPERSFVDLSDVDLRGIDLSERVLIGANLAEANLSGASLYETDLTMVNLSGADFTETLLTKTRLDLADLRGADLTRVIDLDQDQLEFTRVRLFWNDSRAFVFREIASS